MDERYERICWTALAAGALVALILSLTGCYVGRAEFRGEDMRVYPLFHSQHAATDCQDGTCSEATSK